MPRQVRRRFATTHMQSKEPLEVLERRCDVLAGIHRLYIWRDPRVALSFVGQNTSKEGMREYLVAYGRARITEGGAVPLLRRLAPIYLGPGAVYPPASMQSIAGYVNRIRRPAAG